MPPKLKRGGRKGKRKGQKKRKGTKKKIVPEPPPLHLLTELYKKFDDSTMELYEMRVAMRRKRLETWYMMMAILETKSNNIIFRDYLKDKMDDLQALIDRFLKLIQEVRDDINAAIKKIFDEYDKQIQDYNDKSAQIEEDLLNTKMLLREFEPMMKEFERLMAILEQIKKDIEAAKYNAALKKRHLTNQFLNERGRLHNHLEDQLCLLIQHCRSYLMPILWNFMHRVDAKNACIRWKLNHTDEKNVELAERRDELICQRKLLTLEKPYWNIQWAIYKMSEIRTEMCKRNSEVNKIKKSLDIREVLLGKTGPQMAKLTTQPGGEASSFQKAGGLRLAKDFNKFLIQRLTAASAAQKRHGKSDKIVEESFMQIALERAATERNLRLGKEQTFYLDDDSDDGYADNDWDDIDYYETDNDEEEGAGVGGGGKEENEIIRDIKTIMEEKRVSGNIPTIEVTSIRSLQVLGSNKNIKRVLFENPNEVLITKAILPIELQLKLIELN